MSETFAALAGEYPTLLAAMKIDTRRENQLMGRAKAILAKANAQNFPAVMVATGVPKIWGIASFERESSSDYATSPAQGDPWDRPSIHVPRGLGPYANWAQSAIAAYRIDHLDLVGADKWTWARGCYEGELFNGFGPRAHGRHTGYLWAWTNIYTGGKYVADNVWDPNAQDAQCGMVPMMVALLQLDPSLALSDALPTHAPAPVSPPQPAPPGLDGGEGGVPALQARLNALGADPQLVVDGSYGRATRRAVAAFQAEHHLTIDGIAGAATLAAMAGVA